MPAFGPDIRKASQTATPLQTAPASKKSGYLPSLDGWRAFAILGVMMTHDAPWTLGRFSNATWKGYGGDGVYLFFAISGLLICWRILEEESLVGAFHLRSFYIRRIFRIQPAAFVYLAVVASLILAGAIHEYWRFWFGALLLYQNFTFHALNRHLIVYGLFTGHFWTLAVEEHFYIVLSLLLFTVRRQRILVFAILLVLIKLAQKSALAHGLYSEDVSLRRTWWLIQFLLLPAFVALLLRVPAMMAFCRRWLHPWLVFGSMFALLILEDSRHAHHLVVDVFHHGVSGQESLIFHYFPLWLVATMLHPRSWTTRLLELPPIRFFGRISYSVYLWHVLFYHLTSEQVSFAPLRVLGTRPWMYLCTAVFACASYYLVEKPCMRLGHRLAPPATAGRLDMTGEPTEAPLAIRAGAS